MLCASKNDLHICSLFANPNVSHCSDARGGQLYPGRLSVPTPALRAEGAQQPPRGPEDVRAAPAVPAQAGGDLPPTPAGPGEPQPVRVRRLEQAG